jgi:hypothetical protein
MKKVTKTWRYEPETKTIRSIPENYWIASMDSFDGALDHKSNANLIAAAPEMLAALKAIQHNAEVMNRAEPHAVFSAIDDMAREVINIAEGRKA